MQLVGFTIEIYYDARPNERHILITSCVTDSYIVVCNSTNVAPYTPLPPGPFTTTSDMRYNQKKGKRSR